MVTPPHGEELVAAMLRQEMEKAGWGKIWVKKMLCRCPAVSDGSPSSTLRSTAGYATAKVEEGSSAGRGYMETYIIT